MTQREPLEALVVDWGGVLTPPLDATIAAWAQRDHIDFDHFRDVMRRWVGSRRDEEPAGANGADGADGADGIVAQVEQAPDEGPAADSPVHALERGELAVADFEHLLADELAARGSAVQAPGLLGRMFADFEQLSESMVGLVRRVRASGLRTALLSNSWGDGHYPEALFDGLFDVIVISGRVGMRKPEERIYRHVGDLLGLPTSACVLVDDLPHNIRGAAAAGMVGVLHSDFETTVHELEVLFDRSLR